MTFSSGVCDGTDRRCGSRPTVMSTDRPHSDQHGSDVIQNFNRIYQTTRPAPFLHKHLLF